MRATHHHMYQVLHHNTTRRRPPPHASRPPVALRYQLSARSSQLSSSAPCRANVPSPPPPFTASSPHTRTHAHTPSLLPLPPPFNLRASSSAYRQIQTVLLLNHHQLPSLSLSTSLSPLRRLISSSIPVSTVCSSSLMVHFPWIFSIP